MSIADDLDKLQRLRESGVLSEEEFLRAKERLLDAPRGDRPFTFGGLAPSGDVEAQTRRWAVLLHVSQYSYFLLPVAGIAVPILIWLLKKDELPGLDAHGRMVVNWFVSLLLYLVASWVLMLVLVGFPLMVLLLLLAVVYPIVAAIKANDGQLWRYPGAIQFLR